MSVLDDMAAKAAMWGTPPPPPPNGHARAYVPPPPPPPAPSRLDDMMAMNEGDNGEHIQYAEIHRIVSMPTHYPLTLEEIEAYSRTKILAEAWNNPAYGKGGVKGFRLFHTQAEALYTYEMLALQHKHGGGFFPIGVGRGKTAIALMIAQAAYMRGKAKILYMVPSNVYGQLVDADIKWARSRVPISYPILEMGGGKSAPGRKTLAGSGKRGSYLMTYSLLSAPGAEEIINLIRPDLVILDECHEVRNEDAARTQRLFRYIRHADPAPEVVALSGSITSKTISDYWHLIKACLRQNCPLPMSRSLLNAWGAVIDAGAGESVPAGHASSGALTPLNHWAKREFPLEQFGEDVPGFRRAYRKRLNHTLGVVTSGDDDIGVSLTISNRGIESPESCEGWESLEALIAKVELEMVTPNGDEIEHAMLTWKWLYELDAGFYNQLTWPDADSYARRRGITPQESAEVLDRAREHHIAGQEYAKILRAWLRDKSKPGIDTPMLAGNEMARNGDKVVGPEMFEAWSVHRQLDFAGRPERDRTAIRVCDYKVRAAVQWAKEVQSGRGVSGSVGGIIWVWNSEVGRWIYGALLKEGLDTLHCPAGNQYNAAILDQANVNKIVVASIRAHGQGKNLQHFQEQLAVQWPRSASRAEQMLGRLHRSGQKADALVAWTLNSSEFSHMNYAACLNDALYAQQTTDTRMKVIYANYDPIPKIFPSGVLYERGFQTQKLTPEQQRILDERFGRV